MFSFRKQLCHSCNSHEFVIAEIVCLIKDVDDHLGSQGTVKVFVCLDQNVTLLFDGHDGSHFLGVGIDYFLRNVFASASKVYKLDSG